MKDKWQENKSAELQQYADEIKNFFAGMKAVYGPSPNTMVPVWSADGTLLTEKSDIVQHWNEHFSQLLNGSTQIAPKAIQDIPQCRSLKSPDCPPPTLEETKKAIKQLQVGKAPGPDRMPPKVYKEGGDSVAAKLTELIQQGCGLIATGLQGFQHHTSIQE